jgi:hypothetical protein
MDAKIRLSAKEMRMVQDSKIILTKNAILQKVKEMLGDLQEQYHLAAGEKIGNSASPKISRGENYKGLPWLMLDYPRKFEKGDVRAIRTMFWWGNYFSITLHLSGRSKDFSEPALLDAVSQLKQAGWYICVSDKEWEHDLAKGNYRPIDSLNRRKFEKTIIGKDFVKLSMKIPLKKWEKLSKRFVSRFSELLSLTD